MIDRDHGIADAGEDRAQPIVFLLGGLLLLIDGDRLQAKVLGPGSEIVVGDAELLDRGGQLFVERLELLVRGLELLVERLELLAAGLRILARPDHRFVRQPQLRDLRCELVVRPQQPVVACGGLVESFPHAGVAAPLAFDGGDVGQ